MTQQEIDALDPGIRALVVMLQLAGFDTTDSGDGVSKPKEWYESGEAMPFPNIAASLEDGRFLVHESHRMADKLNEHDGPDWKVQGSYCTDSKSFVLLATKGSAEEQMAMQYQAKPAIDYDRLEKVAAALLAHDAKEHFDRGFRSCFEAPADRLASTPSWHVVDLLQAMREHGERGRRIGVRYSDSHSLSAVLAVRFVSQDELDAFERVTSIYLEGK